MPAPIVSEASPPTAEPVTPPPQQRLTVELDNVVSALDEIDSFIHVCLLALRQQNCDADGSVAVVLDATWGKVSDARNAIETAIELLPEEVSDGR